MKSIFTNLFKNISAYVMQIAMYYTSLEYLRIFNKISRGENVNG